MTSRRYIHGPKKSILTSNKSKTNLGILGNYNFNKFLERLERNLEKEEKKNARRSVRFSIPTAIPEMEVALSQEQIPPASAGSSNSDMVPMLTSKQALPQQMQPTIGEFATVLTPKVNSIQIQESSDFSIDDFNDFEDEPSPKPSRNPTSNQVRPSSFFTEGDSRGQYTQSMASQGAKPSSIMSKGLSSIVSRRSQEEARRPYLVISESDTDTVPIGRPNSTSSPRRKTVIPARRGLSMLLSKDRNKQSPSRKFTPNKPPFGSNIPRDFSVWQKGNPDYTKQPVNHKFGYLRRKSYTSPTSMNLSPFARPGESRSQELLRVGKAMANIPCNWTDLLQVKPRGVPIRLDVKRRVFRGLYGEKADIELAKDYVWEMDQIEKRRKWRHYEQERDDFFPKLTAELIEELLHDGMDLGLRRMDSDAELEPGVYRQRYGKRDIYAEDIIIVEKLSEKEEGEFFNRPRRDLMRLLGKNVNLNEVALKRKVIMLPVEPRKVYRPWYEKEEMELSELTPTNDKDTQKKVVAK